MGLLNQRKRARIRRALSGGQLALEGEIHSHSQRADEHRASRYEPEVFAAPAMRADPYAAWLEQREEERRREGPAVRFVHGPRVGGRRVGTGQPQGDPGLARITPDTTS